MEGNVQSVEAEQNKKAKEKNSLSSGDRTPIFSCPWTSQLLDLRASTLSRTYSLSDNLLPLLWFSILPSQTELYYKLS
jgi:hypothetical protein